MTRARSSIGPTLALLAAATSSCSSRDVPPTDGLAMTDGATASDAQDAPPPAHNYTFVLDHLTIDDDDSPTAPHTGFNLDGLFSGPNDANGCNHQDFFSAIDPDQNCAMVGTNGACASGANAGCLQGVGACVGGVDNQLPTLANTIMMAANTDIRRSFADSIDRSALVILVRVLGITDPADMEQASGVTVNLYFGYPTFGGACTAVTAGQAYSVSRNSLVPGATSIDQAMYSYRASIHRGRIVVATDASNVFDLLVLPAIRGAWLGMHMQAFQLRANVSATGLTLGAMGGWVLGGSLIRAVTRLAPDYCNVVEGAIGGLVDIQLNGICDDSSTGRRVFGGIGLGFGFTAVPALISATTPIADYQAPMTCSYTPPVDAGSPWPPDGGGVCQ